jgi:hypothetical protein
VVWPPHGRGHQLWFLRPSGQARQAPGISAENGLALDAASFDEHENAVLSTCHADAHQRWSLDEAPDGGGYCLTSAHDSRGLAAGEDLEPGWMPWLTGQEAEWRQQWLLSVPHRRPI